ncbi:MAG: ice-binding family protein [Thermoplasmata archaeon]|jgi:ice-binding like protein
MNRSLIASLAAVTVIAVLMASFAVGTAQIGTSSVTGARAPTQTQIAAVTGTNGPASSGPLVCGESPIPLGAAGNFAVLAGTTVTNTLKTVVHGNIGVSPGSAVKGFPPGVVIGGKIDKANTASANGQTALVKAYDNGMGRTNCRVTLKTVNIGGHTLGPGLYFAPSVLSISSGDLTLTGVGGSGKVFIFQVTSKLVVTSGRHVILAGGALASNIFWVVGSSATLGSTSIMYGTILAHTSISMATGAVLHGKALAHTGAVTLEGNTVFHISSVVAIVSNLVPSPVLARSFL